MNFDRSETQQILADSADRLMQSRGTVEHWRARRALPFGLDTGGWDQFAELGWIALPIAEDLGGLGGSAEDVALLMIALGRGLAVEPYVSTAVLSAHILDRSLSAEGRAVFLGQIAAGALRVALAHDEPDDRYGVSHSRSTTARTTPEGFVLDGVKILSFDAPSAQRLLVTAALDQRPGTAVFLIETDQPGVDLTPYPLIDGSWAGDVRLTGVDIDRSALIVGPEDGVGVLDEALDRASIALMAQAVGSMEACLELCSEYLKSRKQFGQPIGAFQVLQHMAVDMFVAAHQARSMLYQALASVDAPSPVRNGAVSAAKIIIGEAARTVSRLGIQIHGGYGLTDEYAISHHYRRLLSLEKQYGDIDHHTRRLADVGLA